MGEIKNTVRDRVCVYLTLGRLKVGADALFVREHFSLWVRAIFNALGGEKRLFANITWRTRCINVHVVKQQIVK